MSYLHRRGGACSRSAVALLLTIVLLAACGSTEPDAPAAAVANDVQTQGSAQPDSATDTEPAEVDEPATEPTPEPDSQSDGPSMNDVLVMPINEALGFDPDDRRTAINAFINDAESRVQECMLVAGFDYTPRDTGFAPSFERQLELEASLTPEQFTTEYGYGIATLFELNFQDKGVLQFVETLLGTAPDVERSAAEQEAYDLTLSGRSIVGLSAEDAQAQAFDDPGNAADGSCRQIGYDEAENPQGRIFEGLQSLLGDELAALDERIASDSRLVESRREWQRCIGAAGYSYERPEEIRDFIEGSANDIGERFTGSPEALALFAKAISANLAGMDSDARFAFLDSVGAFQGFSMVPDLQVELDALIEYELEVAQTSFDCTDKELVLQVEFEMQQEFVQTHADQLALIVRGQD